MALEVHGITEPFPFGPRGGFGDWLYARYGWRMASGWAYAIEENAGMDDPLDVFFRLVGEYRAAAHAAPRR
ncbi:hypothetical protein ACIA8G_24275 [Lentzea sp. NPDC051213]|uniref:hypothetical protein n=1 Tax=Lentzea sp. NPDC051213 TaxID=3364126 RepID=UPI0037B46B58